VKEAGEGLVTTTIHTLSMEQSTPSKKNSTTTNTPISDAIGEDTVNAVSEVMSANKTTANLPEQETSAVLLNEETTKPSFPKSLAFQL